MIFLTLFILILNNLRLIIFLNNTNSILKKGLIITRDIIIYPLILLKKNKKLNVKIRIFITNFITHHSNA